MKKLVKKVATSALAATLVLPAGIAGAATKFPDVNSNTVTPDVQQAIEALAAQGIIQGFPDGTFGPNKSITRAQFAKILAQVQGLQPNPAAAAHFTDVKDPEQQGWVGALYAAGLTTGTTATTYSPNRPIQRDQAATFLVRALDLTDVAQELNLTPKTSDGARINDSHRANVGLLNEIGLIKGYPDGRFGPGDPFKRQQAANLLYKIQQNRDEYIAAAKALVNKVEVTQNEDGTVTIKATVSGAASADVAVSQTKDDKTNVLFEQKGVKADENGVVQVTTDRKFNTPGTYDVKVVAYNAAGTQIAELSTTFTVGESSVKGYTEAPDLIRVEADGKYVTYVFDEPVDDVEDEGAFYLVLFNGAVVSPSDVELKRDGTVEAEFTAEAVALATLAGVEQGAVIDEDGNESIEAVLPLNDVSVGGKTDGPDLVSVKVEEAFKGDNSANPEKFEVRFTFDEEVDEYSNAPGAAQNFRLYLADGSELQGQTIKGIVNKRNVIVEFDTDSSATGNNYKGPSYTVTHRDILHAAVLPGVVEDDKDNPNPVGAVRVNGRTNTRDTNYLTNAKVDFEEGKLVFNFNNNVEVAGFTEDVVRHHFYVVTVASQGSPKVNTYSIADLEAMYGTTPANFDIDIDRKVVEVKLADLPNNAGGEMVSQLLASIVAVGVGPADADYDSDGDGTDDVFAGATFVNASNNNETLLPGVVAIKRSFEAGTHAYAPVLEEIEWDYDAKDEELTVDFVFNRDVKVDSIREAAAFKLYDKNGKEIYANAWVDKVNDDLVRVKYELDEDELDEVVVVAVELGVVTADEDFNIHGANPAFHVPLN